jgi:hypothetical protein
MNEYETNLLAETAAHTEPILDRLTALELSVSWLLSRQPVDNGHRFLCTQANDLEEQQYAPGVVAALDRISGFVSALRELTPPVE